MDLEKFHHGALTAANVVNFIRPTKLNRRILNCGSLSNSFGKLTIVVGELTFRAASWRVGDSTCWRDVHEAFTTP